MSMQSTCHDDMFNKCVFIDVFNIFGSIRAFTLSGNGAGITCRMAAAPYPAYQNGARWNGVGRISASAIRQCISDTVFAFISNMAARGCVPAEIGEPKRE
ncbi:hypothetical protein [Kosakonia sp. 1610]|uniref:hypothetical protein n=1 Tax=Kosakonia sp. 1610 TaxID=3156426 RepID=UPI003D19B808